MVREELDRDAHRAGRRRATPGTGCTRFVITTIDLEAQPRRDGWLLWLEYWRAAPTTRSSRTDADEVDRGVAET